MTATQNKSPYDIIKHLHLTEKTRWLTELQDYEGRKNWTACEKPIYSFIVDPRANKREIKWAVEAIYADKNVKVKKVNVITGKRKPRRVRGRVGKTSAFKKAIVWLEAGDKIEE